MANKKSAACESDNQPQSMSKLALIHLRTLTRYNDFDRVMAHEQDLSYIEDDKFHSLRNDYLSAKRALIDYAYAPGANL